MDNTKIVITPNNYKVSSGNKLSSNLLGNIVNSYEEDNESINDFSVLYHEIDNLTPRYVYINYDDTYIMVSENSSEFKGVFTEKSLNDDAFKIKKINPSFRKNTDAYKQVDRKNYEVLDDN